jgi:putative RNA 2'-phosphotransferase
MVHSSEKQRFAIDGSGTRIRANQGHSVAVDLQLAEAEPPAELYHGTVSRFLDSIRASGLHRGERHHVHLSADRSTAGRVGERRGHAVILRIAAVQMRADGHRFWRSQNGVWLVDAVPPHYLSVDV